MKKLLALVLALVMTMSLVTISNAAFKDADKISNKEAVDVMVAVGVLAGYDNGEFGATDTLTREQAAKIIAYLDLGEDIAEALPAVKVFNDVEASRWSAKYIAYCADAGYIAGIGNGNFDPAGKLTGYAFGKMLLCALGYDAEYEQFTGPSWQISVAKLMKTLDIAKSVSKIPSAVLTREEAAQYALNTLKTQTVTANKGTTTTVGGVTVTTGATAATPDPAKAGVDYDSSSDGKQQLCEKLYGTDLKLRTATPDDFGRAAHTWFWKGTADKNKVGSYADTADYTFVVSSTKKTANVLAIIDELGVDATNANKNTFKGQTVKVGDTVEIFTDKDGKATSAIIFNTQLAKVTKVAAASKDADYAYTVTLKTASATKSFKDTDLTGFVAATMTKDTYVTYTTVSGKTGVAVAVAEKVTGKVTGDGSDYVKIDSTKHTNNGTAVWNVDTYDYTNTFDVYLDANGYVIGAVKVTDINTIDNIFFVSEANFVKGTSFADDKAQLKVYYLDGTTKVINMTIDSDKKVNIGGTKTALDTANLATTTAGNFYAYTMDGEKVSKITKIADGVVKNTTQLVAAGKDVKFTAKEPVVEIGGTKFYASSTTKIVMIDKDGKATTITGYSKLPAATYTTTAATGKITAAGYLYVADKTDLKELYIVGAAERVGAVDTAVYGYYVKTGDANYNTEDKVLVSTIVFNVDGKNTDYQIKTADLASAGYEGLYELEVKDGYVTTKAAANINKVVQSVGDGYVVIGDAVIKLADTCGIYDATDKEAIAEGSLNEGDIVSYTVSDSKINRIYVAYAAQDDGVIKGEKTAAYAAYLKSLGYNDADAASHSALGKNGVLVKFAVDTALTGNLTVDVKNTSVDPATTFTYTFSSVTWAKDSTHSVMIDLLNDYNSNHSGTAYPVGSYEVVVKVGSTEVASYTFSVEA